MYEPQQHLPTPSDFNFPFPPYEIQQQLMTELYKVLENKEIGIFESPTGTGKSLTLTCAALKWLEDHEALIRKELLQRLEKITKDVEKLEKEQNVASDWISMHSKTSEQKQELLELKGIKKLLDEYEDRLKVIKEKRKILKQQKRASGQKTKKTSSSLSAVDGVAKEDILDQQNVILEEANNSDADDDDEDEDLEKPMKYRDVQIFFCSRTHTQLAQVVKEVKRTVYGERVRCVSMASRQQLCIHKDLRKITNTALINELCLDMAKNTNSKVTSCDGDGCAKKKSRINMKSMGKCSHKSQALVQELSELSLAEILDIEDLVSEGEELKACPYYAARMAIQMGQLVMLPYQLLLHKRSRELAGIDLRGSIVIIDEAHNLLDCISDIYSCEISLAQLQSVQHQIVAYKMKYASRFNSANLLSINRLIFVIKRLVKLLTAPAATLTEASEKSNKFRMLCTYELMSEGDFFNIDLFELLKFCERTRFAQKLQGFAKTLTMEPKPSENQPPAPHAATAAGGGKAAAVGLLKRLQHNHEEKLMKSSNKTKKQDVGGDVKVSQNPSEEKKQTPAILTSSLRPLLAFLEALCEKADDGRILVNVSSDETAPAGKYDMQPSLKYILLRPESHFQDIVKEARSIIVAGGTMQPTNELTEQLFSSCPERIKQHFYDHVVPDDAVLPFVVTKGPSGRNLCFNFQQRSSTVMLNELCSVLENLCNVIPAGVVCFVPSYDYLNSVYEQLQKTGILQRISNKKRIFREPRSDNQSSGGGSGVGGSAVEQNIEQILSEYSRVIKNQQGGGGALLLSVVGGKLSEGLNFADNLGRGVIVVGLPYPYCNSPEIQERMSHLDKTLGAGSGAEYYENLCMKAVNQCIGRSVRHIRDYACVYLLDERYARENIQRKLPQWISRHLQVATTYGKVQAGTVKFFKQKKLKGEQAEEDV
ncbi:ATP-dependent DNA helicase DDX11 [Musca vetustissima]|uniref:ATP-dependent DNA helicase DDX11 n=1 Tax=Musca vetustissima TaxID=27455 RepID=UPI002AB785B0|nr:ATP-dependent DNA helicase DDX11 [Musca vetustissima]